MLSTFFTKVPLVLPVVAGFLYIDETSMLSLVLFHNCLQLFIAASYILSWTKAFKGRSDCVVLDSLFRVNMFLEHMLQSLHSKEFICERYLQSVEVTVVCYPVSDLNGCFFLFSAQSFMCLYFSYFDARVLKLSSYRILPSSSVWQQRLAVTWGSTTTNTATIITVCVELKCSHIYMTVFFF